MRVLIFTSSGGTAHDVAAYALRDWLRQLAPDAEVCVDQVLENASWFTRGGTSFYNWIQKKAPWLHQIYWRIVELEDLIKPGTVLFGHQYLVHLLRSFQPDLLISTHPHTNRGHFDLAKRVVGPQLRCITCCTELDGGFGFSRNWVSRRTDLFWTLTPGVDQELRRRRFPSDRVACLGPLHAPAFHQAPAPAEISGALPLLVLGSGANGANNHLRLLDQLLPFAGQLRVIALCGKRTEAMDAVQAWRAAHPAFDVETRGFLGPEAMADLYRQAWALVARPGARTATEALTMGCPLIFNHYGLTMPQELLAPRHFKRLGLEVSIRRPRQLAPVVQRWLEDPAAYRALRLRYADHRLASDPQQILERLIGA
jgi:processive 1,2-diacylglycerol beta-glucosyltransferase